MIKFILTIKNPDGSIYWTEGFDSKKALNDWLREEQTRVYWNKDFVIEVVDNSAAVKADDDARKSALDGENAKRKTLRDKLKALRGKKNRTAADALDALDALIDFLGVD